MESNKKEKVIFASDTSGRTLKEWVKVLGIQLAGLFIAHFGIAFFILSDLGSDPFTIFVQGLANVIHVTVGTSHVIILAVLMAVMLFTTKGYIKPGSVVCVVFGGPILDLALFFMGRFISPDPSVPFRVILMVAGCVILSFGMSVVVNSDAGTAPHDLIALILSDKLPKIEFSWIRMGCDLFFAVAGFLMGGRVGIGSIVSVSLIGPFVQFWLPRTRKLLRRA